MQVVALGNAQILNAHNLSVEFSAVGHQRGNLVRVGILDPVDAGMSFLAGRPRIVTLNGGGEEAPDVVTQLSHFGVEVVGHEATLLGKVGNVNVIDEAGCVISRCRADGAR